MHFNAASILARPEYRTIIPLDIQLDAQPNGASEQDTLTSKVII